MWLMMMMMLRNYFMNDMTKGRCLGGFDLSNSLHLPPYENLRQGASQRKKVRCNIWVEIRSNSDRMYTISSIESEPKTC